MSLLVKEIPKDVQNVPVENSKWSLKKKIFVAICAIISYILLVMSANALYAKHTRLNKMDELCYTTNGLHSALSCWNGTKPTALIFSADHMKSVLKTQDMMHRLHSVDRRLAIQLERMDNMLYDEDYEMTEMY